MSGETDKLIGLAHQISPNPMKGDGYAPFLGREGDQRIDGNAIAAQGTRPALLRRQAGIITDKVHTKARIEKISAREDKRPWRRLCVVIAGFQGVTEGESDVTTLGRGGSDLSAVAVAAAVNATSVRYTLMWMVFILLIRILFLRRGSLKNLYEEMLELASLGAKVLQTRSVEFAKKYKVLLLSGRVLMIIGNTCC